MGASSAVPTHSWLVSWEGTLCSASVRRLMNKYVAAGTMRSAYLTFFQIVLYVVSRVVSSFIPRAGTPYSSSAPAAAGSAVKPMPPDSRYFTLFAALSWGAVMWLFEHRGETIQPGMFNSMTYLYRDSEKWKDLKTLLWHNR